MMSSKVKVIVCLLRNDLRLHDNEVLHWANKTAEYVLPLYCFDPRHFQGTYHFDFPKTGAHRAKFLLQSVADLQNTLKSKGSGLVIRMGKPEEIVPQIINTVGQDQVSFVCYHEEATAEELEVESKLQKSCGVKVQSFWGHPLYHRDDLPFRIQQLPDVYTQFRKNVEGQARVRKSLTMPDKLQPLPPGVEEGQVPSLTDLGLTAAPEDPRSVMSFQGGETVALDRLNHYLWQSDSVSTYKETRNGLVGSDYSTKFSVWLANGCISPRHIYWEIKKYEAERLANQSTYWVTFELLWRDYFRYVALKYGKKLFSEGGIQEKAIPWKRDRNLLKAWMEGKTGVPFVDANMRELAATGFMSNRGRQNVASFLTKDLKLDWRMGAEWFESQLIDHDVCSNYGNWLYSAGIGNDPREDRKFNMIKQGLDYDPERLDYDTEVSSTSNRGLTMIL
ncbi:cryptochrome DASH-like, partial [Ylistrum balloti]|uniref:cryptochrome DASH-like n=1 Tax=Ylistrum balloti TaxID=509963 RepID=UPI002905A522